MNIGFTYISMANSTFTQNSTCLAVKTLLLCQASKVNHRPIHFNSKIKYNCFSVQEQKITVLRLQKDPTRKMNIAVYANLPPGDSLPVDPSPGNWKVWTIGTIVTVVLSFITRGKWGPLLQLKEKIETTIDEAERVADIVEDVAERVENVAEEAVKNLPKGKLHDAAELVENVAQDIDKYAQNAEDILEKDLANQYSKTRRVLVDELKGKSIYSANLKVEDMEKAVDSFFESTTSQERSIAMTSDSKDQK